MLIVQRCRILAAAKNAMVGLFLRTEGDAGGYERGFEILFVSGRGDGAEDSGVGSGRDGVGVAEERDFVVVFLDAAFIYGGVEEIGVCGEGMGVVAEGGAFGVEVGLWGLGCEVGEVGS